METLEIKASLQIQKPVREVFEAIVNPDKMSKYFISESTGKMEEDKELVWRFPEFDINVPVRVGKIEQDKYISYYWDGAKDRQTLVGISLEAHPDHSTGKDYGKRHGKRRSRHPMVDGQYRRLG